MSYSVGQEINKLKKTFLMRAGLTVLLLPVFILIQLPISASIDTAYTAVYSEVVSHSARSCAESKDVIPDAVYVRLGKGLNQSYSGFEIYLSFENGKCPELLYSSIGAESVQRGQLHEADDFVVALN